jgi:hypothetical protein
MLTRFISALASAVVLAALVASGSGSAQAPPAAQGAKPAAQAGEKQAKTPSAWPPDADTLRKRRQEAEALPLFSSHEPIDVVITADWKAVQGDRDVDSEKLYPGTFAIVKGGAPGAPIPIELRTRGHVRRNPLLCSFAPLRLELPKDKTKGTIFEGHGNIKLGTHCENDGIYQQYTLKEYLANRLHNVLTPRSLRVRIARVTYADQDPGKKPFTKLGIFYERADDMAKRMEARELPVPRQMFQFFDQPSLLFMSLFQYMIGNVDYSILTLHNVIILDTVKGAKIPVPYDFDYSGLVNAQYAVPAKGLPILSVRDRFYRGPCKTEAELEQGLAPFREKQAEMLALPASLQALGLTEGQRKDADKYLRDFFELIGRPDRLKRTFVTDCKPIPGM